MLVTSPLQPSKVPLSLYIHLPWCERKCPYCDFNSYQATTVIPQAAYINRLVADLRSQLNWLNNRPIISIFIGGGTPSLFAPEYIDKLLQAIAAEVTLADNLEITMEANPGSVEQAKFKEFYAIGINRLSLGVQSFADQQLMNLGRVHTAAQANGAIEKIIQAGFTNFNVDLMYGLPGQSIDDALADLHQALAYQPNHVSWYELTLEPNTVFWKKPPANIPKDHNMIAIQQAGQQLLAENGYDNYEISAYAKNHYLDNGCIHNLNYWQFGDYLGIGAGAHGKLTIDSRTILRIKQLRIPNSYLNQQTELINHKLELSAQDRIAEFMLNGLRLRFGIKYQHLLERAGNKYSTIASIVNKLITKKLLVDTAEGIKSTRLGWQFLNSVLQEFI